MARAGRDEELLTAPWTVDLAADLERAGLFVVAQVILYVGLAVIVGITVAGKLTAEPETPPRRVIPEGLEAAA